MHKPIMISIVVCTYNKGRFICDCIDSILKQTFKNFELVIVNDGSTDKTEELVKKYNDKRIRYIKLIKNTGSPAISRQIGISKAVGKFIFTTDSDCKTEKNWLKNGIKIIENKEFLAVEGPVIYNYFGYTPTLEDRNVLNLNGGKFMTANMVYKREVFKHNKFEKRYDGYEDRALALKILKIGKIAFEPNMIVIHNKETRTCKSMLKETKRIIAKIRLIKDHIETKKYPLRVIQPGYLILIFFPPLLLVEFIKGRIRSLRDLLLLPCIYINAIYLRYWIWYTAFKEGVFVV